MSPTREHIIADLRRVARETDAPEGFGPSLESYRRHGTFTEHRVRLVAGGRVLKEKNGRYRSVPALLWPPALIALGFRPLSTRGRTDRDSLVEDLRRVARKVGRPREMPTQDEYVRFGRWSHQTVHNWFRYWSRAAKAAGLRCRRRLTAAQLLRDYRLACAAAGLRHGDYGLTQAGFSAQVEYSAARAALDRFGSWNALVERAGYRPRPWGGQARYWNHGDEEAVA